jgi:hypothetical protein
LISWGGTKPPSGKIHRMEAGIKFYKVLVMKLLRPRTCLVRKAVDAASEFLIYLLKGFLHHLCDLLCPWRKVKIPQLSHAMKWYVVSCATLSQPSVQNESI